MIRPRPWRSCVRAARLAEHAVNIRLCITLAHFCVSVFTLSVIDTFSIPHLITNELPSGIVRAACSLLVRTRSRVPVIYHPDI